MFDNQKSTKMELITKQTKQADLSVMTWTKRYLLVVLLILGIPAGGFAVYSMIRHGQQLKPMTLEDLTEKGAGVCHECGKAANGYWYNEAFPDRAQVYFCKRHQYSNYSEIEEALIPFYRLKIYIIIGLVLLISPFMLMKYRLKRLEIIPIDSLPSMGAPPRWFWLCVLFNTILYPVAPFAFFIGIQGYRAYPRGSSRRRWGIIACTWGALEIISIALLVILIIIKQG